MIDYRIKTFLKLCECMNYRITAEKLNMTHPAVTQHIHYLENFYNCKLFVYDRKSLKITKEGEELRKYAENIIYQENKFFRYLNGKSETKIKMGATKTIGEYVIASHVAKYLSIPENNISVEVDNTDNLLSLLKAGKLDFALIEGYFDSNEFAHKIYRKEDFLGICSKEHPFAKKEVEIEELFNNTLFIREEGSGTRMIFEQFLEAHNKSIQNFDRVVCISNFGLMEQLIYENCGITFGYQSIADLRNNLSTFHIKNKIIEREFNYVYLDTPYSRYLVDRFDAYK